MKVINMSLQRDTTKPQNMESKKSESKKMGNTSHLVCTSTHFVVGYIGVWVPRSGSDPSVIFSTCAVGFQYGLR